MNLQLEFLEGEYSVCQLAADDLIPPWASGEFLAIIRTADELTIVVKSEQVPRGVKSQTGFACIRVVSKLEFDVVGVIAGISSALAESGIPILSISTFDTDYFLTPANQSPEVRNVLAAAGYKF